MIRHGHGLLAQLALLALVLASWAAQARDLPEIVASGELRHIGIPYANFVTGSGDGLDVEIMRGFAAELGVRYVFVPSDWNAMYGDLTGRHARFGERGAEFLDVARVRGDVIANGVTVLDWREEVFDFGEATFPSGVWLLARAESQVTPIRPSGSLADDIAMVKAAMDGISVLAQENTCLDPALYGLSKTRAEVRLAGPGIKPDELAPAVLDDMAETTLLDVPDALIALERWPGRFKVIGPVSEHQVMAPAFRKQSPQLRDAFNRYLQRIRRDGSYTALVKKYYPNVSLYYAEFFAG